MSKKKAKILTESAQIAQIAPEFVEVSDLLDPEADAQDYSLLENPSDESKVDEKTVEELVSAPIDSGSGSGGTVKGKFLGYDPISGQEVYL